MVFSVMKSLALREKLAAKAREVNKEEASNGKVDKAASTGNYWKAILRGNQRIGSKITVFRE